jgi:hypothetical protein
MGRGWSLGQENLYQRIVAGEQVTPEVAKQFFPIYKLHYFGALGNSPIATTAMHKYAVSPLIPNLTGTNSNLDKLHELMMKNNIQYLTFNSASKGATYVTEGGINAKPDQIFKDKNFKEYEAWKNKLKTKREGRTPSLGMKHTKENKKLFSEISSKYWSTQKKYNSIEILKYAEIYGMTKTLKEFKISKTHFYRLKKRALTND